LAICPVGARKPNHALRLIRPAILFLGRSSVRAASGQPHEVEMVIDTGFNGFLTLPPALIAALGLRWLCRQQAELADGSVQAFDVYVAPVDWDGQPRVWKWRLPTLSRYSAWP
jgi:clan AA aspartic protease